MKWKQMPVSRNVEDRRGQKPPPRTGRSGGPGPPAPGGGGPGRLPARHGWDPELVYGMTVKEKYAPRKAETMRKKPKGTTVGDVTATAKKKR